MSDDGWLGDQQEPAPPPGSPPYGQGRGRRASQGRQPQPGQPDPYAQQYPQQYPQDQQQYPAEQQYSQDPYAQNQYAQSYPAQPQQSYYDEQSRRATAQEWDTGQQGYSNQPSYSEPQNYSEQQSYSGQQSYQQPQQPQPQQPQQPAQPTQRPEQQYGRRGRPQQPRPQQAARPADPYAAGSYGSDAYASDAYSPPSPSPSNAYASDRDRYTPADPYASPDPYASSSDRYASSDRRAPAPSDPYAADPYASDPYASSGGYARPARDTNGSAYAPNSRDGYSTGGYPTADRADRDPRQSSGTYPAAGGYADPYTRRRNASPSQPPQSPSGYAAYEDDDEFPARPSASSRRATGYGDADTRVDSPSTGGPSSEPRSRRRAAGPSDEKDDEGERFSLIDDDDDEEVGSGRGRKPKQKKGRNCLAVFVAFGVIAGGLGYGGYKGVQWYQSKYGAPPDYVSTIGTGAKIDVTIPSGAGGKTIGGLLFNDGIVKSQRAFTDACNSNTKCADIQAGTYLLPKGISASAAVTALLDPKNQDGKTQLITYGGERAGQIFAALEAKTGWKDADIRAAIASSKIGLPAWDTGQPGAKFPYAHIEGFIATETYVLTDFKTPTDLLKKMVGDQLGVFAQEDLANKAAKLKLSEYKLLIIASLARAEAGSNTNDLNKIAGVVLNRFDSISFAHLGFDTSTLYGMGNTTTVPNNADKTNPYNTSVQGITGLPPSPIDNPDQQSIDAALNPNRASNYVYFCATPDGVQYASTNAQWQALGQRYKGLCGSG